MCHCGTSSYAIFIVAQLLLICTRIEILTAYGCNGELLSIVTRSPAHTSMTLGYSYNNRLVSVLVPDCLRYETASTASPLPVNVTYTMQDVMSTYLIVSGNITGDGTVIISFGYKTTTYRSQTHGQGFVFTAYEGTTLFSTTTLSIIYTSSEWVRGDGPYIELFYTTITHLPPAPVIGPVSCSMSGAEKCSDLGNECFMPTTQGCNGHNDCSNGEDESKYRCQGYQDQDCSVDIWRRCSVTASQSYICLPQPWRCNGRDECPDGIDESNCHNCCTQLEYASLCSSAEDCDCTPYSYTELESQTDIDGCHGIYDSQPVTGRTGTLSLPVWPTIVPLNKTYEWWHALSTANSITISFNTIVRSSGDSVVFSVGSAKYDLSAMSAAMQKTVSLDNADGIPKLNILMTSARSIYNISYELTRQNVVPNTQETTVSIVGRGASSCNEEYVRSCLYKDLCFIPEQLCDGYMDCPNGKDEVGCGTLSQGGHSCAKDEIKCGGDQSKPGCFTMKERCDGNQQCSNAYDEHHCDSTLCGTHNGTFLCTDKTCIFETWLCDKTKDCPDGADEQNCDGTSLKVVTASVIGSLVCAIMIVIAVGCSCKLHTHRMYESLHQRSRYESPMTRLTNQLMRRTAPPPYAEAMQRSRPFEEVQSEYLAALEQQENAETNSDAQAMLEEQQSVASASGTLEPTESSLVEVGDENTVSFRRNPNKPPESTQPHSESDQSSGTNVTLEPKSDDEAEVTNSPDTSLVQEAQINNSHSRRQALRRSSIDSDVSMLSRDSDDVPLLT